MASTASTSLNLELQTQGENDGTWGDKQKTNMQILDAAIAGRTTVSLSGADATLADADYTLDAAKYGYLYTSDADQNDRAIIIPNAPRTYIVHNASGTYQISVKTSSGSAITIPAASVCKVSCDGSNTCTFSTPLTNAGTGAPNTSSGAAASAVSVVPSGDLTSTTVQSALTELQGDIDAIEADILANYQPLDTDLTQIAGLARSKGALIAGSASSWTALSAGTNNYALVADSAQTSGVKWGVLPVAGGGTGATTASAARTALGVAIGSDVQAYDAGLASIAGLTTAADRMIYTTASDTYAVATLTSFARTLLDDSSASAARSTLGVAIGSDVQAYDADLAAIAALAKTDGNIIVGNGSTWVAESGSTARTSLGLGSLATASTINGSNWSGTDLALTDGGTGASLSDPNDDRILFWDDSVGAVTWLDIGNALSISGTTLAATAASDSADGTIEIAVQSEMEAASSTILAVTPGRQHFHPGHPKAGGNIDGTGTPSIASGDYGLSSVSDDGVGRYTLGFDTAFADTNYWCTAWCRSDLSNPTTLGVCAGVSDTKTTSSFAIFIGLTSGSSAQANDSSEIGVTFWGDYA